MAQAVQEKAEKEMLMPSVAIKRIALRLQEASGAPGDCMVPAILAYLDEVANGLHDGTV